MNKIIEVKSLEKSYGNLKAIDGLSFDIYDKEIVGLLGPNGSGKTTTINCLLALLKIDAGEIKIFDRIMNPDEYEVKSKIGVVFQDVAVFDELNVYENINYFCSLYIKDKMLRKQYVEEAIELTGLMEFKKFIPKKLSGGLLRRLNIACGIAHKPSLIFLDEPTVAVDPQSRNNILEGIKKLNQNGATIIYTTHYMEEAETLCSRIIIIDKGKVLASGTKQELLNLISVKEIITVEIEITQEIIDRLSKLKEVNNITYKEQKLVISFNHLANNLVGLIEFFKANNLVYSKIFSQLPTLNDVFLELTGKELRD